MSRKTVRWAAIVQICLVLITGCTPTQPFFIPRDESLANYLAQSMDIEYADVQVESLPEATQANIPFGVSNIPTSFLDLTLEDCISITLQNTKIIRVVGGTNSQSGSISAAVLSANAGQLPSIYDPAIVATTGNTQPLAIDNLGNRIAPRGGSRANQVGGVEDALSEFDAQKSMVMGYNTTDRPRNVGQGNIFNPQFFQAVDANFQTALSKRMATGTVATARFTTVYSMNNVPASGNAQGSTNFGRAVPSDYTAAIELQVTQPLLRGRGTLVNRIPVVLARINEDIAVHDFEANVRRLLKDVEDAYWDLQCGYRAFEAAKMARDSAADLYRVAKDRDNIAGDTPPESLAQVKAQYFQFEAQMRAALSGSQVPGFDPRGLYGREQTLREKMGWSPTDGRLIRPADEPTTARVEFDWSSVLAEGLTRNTELRRHKWTIKQRELELISAKNQILPQLDLSGTYRFLGVGDEFANANRSGLGFPNPGSNSLEGLTDGDFQELAFRVEYTPQAHGKRRGLLNIQRSQLEIKKSQEELREKELALSNELSTAWREIESAYGLILEFRRQLDATDEEIGVYTDRITKNSASELYPLLDLLLRAEERRSRAQLNYYQAICEYNQAMVQLHFLKGSLMDLNSVALGEGAWTEKAYWDADERARERASGIHFDYGFTRPGVVSNGSVVGGGATEGNIADPVYRFGTGDMGTPTPADGLDEPGAEEIPAEPLNDEPRPLPKLNAPTAGISDRDGVIRQASSTQASSGSPQQWGGSQAGFNWGSLGINDVAAATESAQVAGRPVQMINQSGIRP